MNLSKKRWKKKRINNTNKGGEKPPANLKNMNSKELKSYFLANKNKWIFLNEVINGKNVQIKAFVGGTVDMQILKIDGVSCGKLNYQSITKTVNHIFEYITLKN